ncbi:MAG: DNRLRE domain-containing protein [Burkholderiales bacterium]|nr:DNRLRE domain-containing protein [Burkholderiales bacterium]
MAIANNIAPSIARLAAAAALVLAAGCGGSGGDDASLAQATAAKRQNTPLAFKAPASVTITDDAIVKENAPTTNFNGNGEFGSDGGTGVRVKSFIKFTVSGVPAGSPVYSALLKLTCFNPTDNGPGIRAVSNSWTEAAVTFNTSPAETSTSDTDNLGEVPIGPAGYVKIALNLMPAVTGNGTFSFQMAQNSTDGFTCYDTEHATVSNRPVVEVHYSDGPSPAGASGSSDLDTVCAGSACSAYVMNSAETWTTFAGYMTPVGTPIHFNTIVGDLAEKTGIAVVAAPVANLVNWVRGMTWNAAEASTTISATNRWVPQGLAVPGELSTTAGIVMVGWYDKYAYGTAAVGDALGSSITIANTNSLDYRRILLVEPTGSGTFKKINAHSGGLARFGNYLYLEDDDDEENGTQRQQTRVFDLTKFYQVSQSCGVAIGRIGSAAPYTWCGGGFKYVLPQVNVYVWPKNASGIPGTLSNGHKVMRHLEYSEDRSQLTQALVFAEYGSTGNSKTTDDCDWDPGNAGLTQANCRIARFPVGVNGRLTVNAGNQAVARKVYMMRTAGVQGLAAACGGPVTGGDCDTYLLNASSSLVKAGLSGPSNSWSSSAGTWTSGNEGFALDRSGTAPILWNDTEGAQSGGTGRGIFGVSANF